MLGGLHPCTPTIVTSSKCTPCSWVHRRDIYDPRLHLEVRGRLYSNHCDSIKLCACTRVWLAFSTPPWGRDSSHSTSTRTIYLWDMYNNAMFRPGQLYSWGVVAIPEHCVLQPDHKGLELFAPGKLGIMRFKVRAVCNLSYNIALWSPGTHCIDTGKRIIYHQVKYDLPKIN